MLRKIKSKLGFIYRGLIGIKDNLFDNPKIDGSIKNFSIGKTVKGDEISCYSFGNGEEKILYFGGIHGNEIGTVKLMNKWVKFIFETNNNIDFGNKKIYVIPCLNIDGYKKALKNPEYFSGGRMGKTNSQEVDLNRNFPTSNWSKKSTLFAAGEYKNISGGDYAGSELETKALLSLIETEDIKTIYTFHNCWGTVFGRGTENIEKKVQSYSQNSAYRIFADSEWNNLKPGQKTGQMMIWAEEKNIDVIEIEMKTRWGSEWKQNKKGLIKSLTI